MTNGQTTARSSARTFFISSFSGRYAWGRAGKSVAELLQIL